jgi:hypothetical protein
MVTWQSVLEQLQADPEAIISTPKADIAPPLVSGAHRSIGVPVGQRGDYRWTLADCRGLHTREFGDHWETHLDAMAPECSLAGHIEQDAPGVVVVAATVVCALAGWALLGRRGVLAGAVVGVGLGAFSIAPTTADRE